MNVFYSKGWDGITKATPLKWYPPEEPNRTDPKEVIKKLHASHRATRKANLNNIRIKEETFLELFEALKTNSSLEELTLANTTLSDYAASKLGNFQLYFVIFVNFRFCDFS